MELGSEELTFLSYVYATRETTLAALVSDTVVALSDFKDSNVKISNWLSAIVDVFGSQPNVIGLYKYEVENTTTGIEFKLVVGTSTFTAEYAKPTRMVTIKARPLPISYSWWGIVRLIEKRSEFIADCERY